MKKHIDLLVERYPELAVCREDIFKAYEIIEKCYAAGGKIRGASAGRRYPAGGALQHF